MVIAGGRTLVVAPYMGEFGWELMNWQGRVRRLALDTPRRFAAHQGLAAGGGYRRIVICATKDRRALYAMPPEIETAFCPIRSFLPPGRANEDHRVDEQGRTIPADELRLVVETAARWACADAGIGLDGATILTPDYKSGLWPTTRGHQLFAELRVETPIKTDVVLVPRRRKLAPERNQPDSWWEDLAGQLREVGLIVEMYPTRLNEAIARLSAARLAAGASTGGLHLASLCRCPHYVWGSGPEARWTPWAITNRQRYETVWNPLGTPCRYDECGWQPTMAHAIDGIRRALDEIGLARGRSLPAWTLRPRWRIKRRLARLLEAPAGGGVVPWRVRQLVREWM